MKGEYQFRGCLRRGEEILAERRVEGVGPEVHAGLRRGGAGLPVVEPEGRTGLHRESGTLSRARNAAVGFGQDGRRLVKILVDLLKDVVLVGTADLIGIFQRNVFRVIRNVAEQEDLVGVEDGAEELGFARILGDLLVGHRFFRLVQAVQDRIRPGDGLVVLGPGLRHVAGRTFQRTADEFIQLRTLVPVVGPAVRMEEPAAFGIPQFRIVERVERIGNLLLVGAPVLAGALGERIQVQVDATRQHKGGRDGGQYVRFHFHRISVFILQRRSSDFPEPAGTAVPPMLPATSRRTGGRRR